MLLIVVYVRVSVGSRGGEKKQGKRKVERGEERSLSDSRDFLTCCRQRVEPADLPLLSAHRKTSAPAEGGGGCFVPALEGCWHIYDMALLNKPLFSADVTVAQKGLDLPFKTFLTCRYLKSIGCVKHFEPNNQCCSPSHVLVVTSEQIAEL